MTSGRAAWTCEWMANAAVFTGAVALDDLALVVDEEQVGHPDVAEVHAERVDPEVVEQLGVAGGDVAGDALVEPELAEQAERRRRGAACGGGAPPRPCRTSAGSWRRP